MFHFQRPRLGKWLGDVSINGDWLATGGGPKPSIWHLKSKCSTAIPDDPGSQVSPIFVTQIIKDDDLRVLIGGQYPFVNQYDFNGGLKSELKTSSSCIYSVASTTQSDFKVLSLAGSNSKIDLCTHNFSYTDNSINFP